jgi:hypothetical protein
MKGKKLFDAALRGDETGVSALLSAPGSQSFINHQDKNG